MTLQSRELVHPPGQPFEIPDDQCAQRAIALRCGDPGALVQLQFALNGLGLHHLLAGELAAAERLIDEDRLIAEATGNPPAGYTALMLAAWHGRKQEASGLIEATVQMATERGLGILAALAASASAVLHNGLGRYDAARDAARQAFERDQPALGHLRTAHWMLDAMGMQAFAERARRELLATSETARKRSAPAARATGASEPLTSMD